jgi:hypothetical protein
MKPFKSLQAITRRILRINYFSPLICQIFASSSGSGSGVAATLEILPSERRSGPEMLSTETLNSTQVRLVWTQRDYIYSSIVYRATTPLGPFVTVTSNVIDDHFIDTPGPGTYYYKVTGIEPDFGETFPSPIAGPVTLL